MSDKTNYPELPASSPNPSISSNSSPSGQVAEDRALLNGLISDGEKATGNKEPDARAALSRLAAKAQGYEAVVAAHAAAERRWETCEAERIAAVEQRDEWQQRALNRDLQGVTLTDERDAAVADNAALLQALLDVADLKPLPSTLNALAERLRKEPHPGAAFLKEKQEQAEVLTMVLHLLEAYAEQATTTRVVILTPEGVQMLQTLINRLRKALR